MITLVGGSGGSTKVSGREYGTVGMGKRAGTTIRKTIMPSATKSKSLAVPKTKEVKPDDVIPMDDDFKDF